MGEATLWERVDEPVLRWVATLPSSLAMEIRAFGVATPEPFDPIPGLNSRDVHQSLQRLRSHRLVDGIEGPAVQSVTWTKLRVAAFGWIVLGEWPDLDRVATAASVHGLLRALADDAPEQVRSALVRAAGVVSRTADEVVRGTAANVAGTVGGDVAGG